MNELKIFEKTEVEIPMTVSKRKNAKYDNTKIAIEIERMVSDGTLTYLEAICEFCEINEIEIEEAPKFLHKNVLEKLKLESAEHNLLKEKPEKSGKLPF